MSPYRELWHPGRMEWDEFVAAAKAISWIAYIGTADSRGRPHVAVVAPGFSPGVIWVATRPGSKKYRNLLENPHAAVHWPVGDGGPGELAARGSATLHATQESKAVIWEAGYMSYDLSQFFGSKDNSDLGFIEVRVERARLLGPGAQSKVFMAVEI